MKWPIGYLAYGLGVVGLMAAAQLNGWGLTRPTEVRDVPRTVRDNPGAYRAVYAYRGTGRYMRGK